MGLVTSHSSFRNQFVQLLYHRYTWKTRHICRPKTHLVQNSQTLWSPRKPCFFYYIVFFQIHVQNRWTNPKIVVQICPNRQKVVQNLSTAILSKMTSDTRKHQRALRFLLPKPTKPHLDNFGQMVQIVDKIYEDNVTGGHIFCDRVLGTPNISP